MDKKDEVLTRAYGHCAKEFTFSLDLDVIPVYRGVKYYFYKLLRWFTR